LKALFDAATEPRDQALFSLMIGVGLRLVEIPRLELDGFVRRQNGTALLYVQPGELHRGRLVPLAGRVLQAVERYIYQSGRRTDGAGALFLDDNQEPLNPLQAALAVLRGLARAGVDPQEFVRLEGGKVQISDVLAWSFAARYLRAGGQLSDLKRRLGHQSLEETQQLEAQLAMLGLPVR
jgi:site-specific recombinase XerC